MLREIEWFIAMILGVVAFGACEMYLVLQHGYLFAFTIGILLSVLGAVVVIVAVYLAFYLFRILDDFVRSSFKSTRH